MMRVLAVVLLSFAGLSGCRTDPANQLGPFGARPLNNTALHGSIPEASTLLQFGADINALDGYGEAPLHNATSGDNEEMVQFLIERGADVHVRSDTGATVLHYAARDGHLRLARWFVALGIDANVRDKSRRTPLHYLAEGGTRRLFEGEEGYVGAPIPGDYPGTAAFLIDHGADVNAVDDEGATPLHFATKSAYVDVLKVLLERGARIDIRDSDGETPLAAAVRSQEEFGTKHERYPLYAEIIGLSKDAGSIQ